MRGRESEIKNISGDARKVPVQDKDISMSYDHFTSRFRNKGGLTTFDCSLSNSGKTTLVCCHIRFRRAARLVHLNNIFNIILKSLAII